MIRRGEIWWADLGEPRGSAPALRRPVIVVQSDHYNDSRLRTIIVVALTANTRLVAMPGNVAVAADLSGLPEDSVANVTQVATIDRDDAVERIGALPAWLVEQVDDGLRRVLAL
ncbi:type II toxin-antitoxin system toxin endoribonuclease MazF6 [soil metagenome]